jgi:hypothetical protein
MNRSQWVPAGILALAAATVVLVPALYATQYQTVTSVFDDVVSYGRLAPLVGFVSDMGVCLWLASAGLMLHGLHSLLAQGRAVTVRDAAFYLSWAALLIVLGLDDRLLLHEWLQDAYGVPELLVVGVYAAWVAVMLVVFRRYCLARAGGWLWLALAAFVVSAAVDMGALNAVGLAGLSDNAQVVIEEGAKWMGICALYLYAFVLTAAPPHAAQWSKK